jgi:hypothetical protein
MASDDQNHSSLAEMAYRVAERFGLPVIIMGVVLWFARDAAVVLHSTVFIPIVKGHTEFLDKTSSTLEEISTTQRQQAATIQELAAGQREIHQAVVRKTGQASPSAN